MRKTETYKLNLLDGADRISPKPLNENMETVERELKSGLRKAAEELAKAVGSGGYNARIAFGSYTGNGGYGSSRINIIETGFRPMAVYVTDPGSDGTGVTYYPGAMVRPAKAVPVWRNSSGSTAVSDDGVLEVTWGDRGISWYTRLQSLHEDLAGVQMNAQGREYHWVAIGFTEPEQEGESNG